MYSSYLRVCRPSGCFIFARRLLLESPEPKQLDDSGWSTANSPKIWMDELTPILHRSDERPQHSRDVLQKTRGISATSPHSASGPIASASPAFFNAPNLVHIWVAKCHHQSNTGWWLGHTSEKYESVGMTFPIYRKNNPVMFQSPPTSYISV